jgi:thymidylate synthase ThyX
LLLLIQAVRGGSKKGGYMAYEAKILADSLSEQGNRLTTLEVTFPRFILAEFNTHRVLSRNSASSRAIPTENRIKQVLENPVLPLEWGANKPGMQAELEIGDENKQAAEFNWLSVRDYSVLGAVALLGGVNVLKGTELQTRIKELQDVYERNDDNAFIALEGESVHKQVVNRILEPFLWHTVVATGTEWENFYALRAHPAAQPEIKHTAELMKNAMDSSIPDNLDQNEWHIPFILEEEKEKYSPKTLAKFAVARCARVSYETHDTGKIDHEKDIKLHDDLASMGHMSPFEHVARPMTIDELSTSKWSGNFKGWHQYRKDIPHESNYGEVLNNEQ